MIVKLGKDYYKSAEKWKYLLCAKATGNGELTSTSGGKTFGKVSIKAQERQDGSPVWMTLKMWGTNGRLVANIQKGDTVLACGELNRREYNGKEYFDFDAEFVSVMEQDAVSAFPASPAPFGAPTTGEEQSIFSQLGDDDGELPF